MKEVFLCPQCKGRGKVHDTAGAFYTLELSFIFECIDSDYMDDCPRCGGSGVIKID